MINSDACVKHIDKICDSQRMRLEGVDTGHSDFFPGESETFLPQPPSLKGEPME